MASLHFDLVSPERLLFSGNVDQVDVPGSEGDFGVLAQHAPLIATLRPGILTIHKDGTQERIALNGGFAEVSPEGLTVLADYAAPVDEVDLARLAAEIKDTGEDAADTKDDKLRDKLTRRVEQLKALQAALGHS